MVVRCSRPCMDDLGVKRALQRPAKVISLKEGCDCSATRKALWVDYIPAADRMAVRCSRPCVRSLCGDCPSENGLFCHCCRVFHDGSSFVEPVWSRNAMTVGFLGLAIRGHDESATSENQGNFLDSRIYENVEGY
jgi:hypothetical protein